MKGKSKNKDKKKQRIDCKIIMRVGPNGFHCAFKSGFFQFTF